MSLFDGDGHWPRARGVGGTAAIFAFWAFVLPACVMVVTLYICRLIPLTGWRQRPEYEHLPMPAGDRREQKQC